MYLNTFNVKPVIDLILFFSRLFYFNPRLGPIFLAISNPICLKPDTLTVNQAVTLFLFSVVGNAMYTIHSFHLPYSQEDFTLNWCWRAVNGRLFLRQFCHVFIARVPALYNKAHQTYSVSFESACLPDHFIRQKNYHFHLQKRDGTELFGKILDFLIS